MESNDLIMRSIKMLDIGYLSVIGFMTGFGISNMIDSYLTSLYPKGYFDPNEADKKSIWNIFLQVCIHLWILGIIIYIYRNIIERVPTPFSFVKGYNPIKVKERVFPAIFIMGLYFSQNNLNDKLKYLVVRIKK
jgi:hypothetical protein